VTRRVLVLTNERDVGSDLVVRIFRERGVPYLRINTERLSERNFTWLNGTYSIETPRGQVDFSSIRSVWMRQPIWPAFRTSPAVSEVLQNQWRAVVRGLASLGASWINPIDAGLAAESKVLQLATAKDVGFDVPETCVSSDVEYIRRFADANRGRLIVKALDAPLIEEDDGSRFVYTSRLNLEILKGREGPELVPMIFQEEITNKQDIRIVVIDEEVFAFKIAGNASDVDWRRGGREAVVTATDSPDHIKFSCINFLSSLGLRFGAFDFAVNDERYAFLECNQNGEWGWLQRATGAPIATGIANALTRTPSD
jgi:glutathione synthase/RimK-type ligase-like ATP-grasp enzyme